MTITVLIRELTSRQIRSQLTRNSTFPGFREITRSRDSDRGGNLSFFDRLKTFAGGTVKVVGWIVGKVFGGIGLTFTSLWGLVVQTTTFIYNFDWNISDQQIDARFASLKLMMAGYAGEIAGNAMGYLACGVLPSAAIMAFNEPLGYYLLKNVGEEALEEFSENLAAFLVISLRSLAASLAYSWFKNTRKAIKLFTSSSNPKSRKMIQSIFGNRLVQAIDQWGEKDSKPWSFRIFVEEKIESIKNPIVQEFVEEFYDEFKDSCVEAGYVVANNLDNWVISRQLERQEQEEARSIVELQPNRENPEESFIFYGDRQQIQNQSLNAINNYNVMESRDVGAWVGEPLRESITKPQKNVALKILLRSAIRPPFKNADGSNAKRTQVEIPNVNRSKIDWKKIKRAVGGIDGYLWGRFCVIARLDDGNKIQFFADSETEGKRILENLLEFTKANLLTLNIYEEMREGARKRYDSLYKKRTRVYPAYVVVINQQQVLDEERGRATTGGYKDHRQFKFPLYTEDKPEDFDRSVSALFLPLI